MQKNFYRNFRRRGNTVFFIVLGGLFLLLGAAALFFMDSIVWAAICFAAGALLLTLPMFVVHASYRTEGAYLRVRVFFPKKIPLCSIGAIVITTYDSYRRWHGFQAERFISASGAEVDVPSVTFLRECDGEELDLCSGRTYTKLTYKKQFLFDAALDFDFLRGFADAGYAGEVYVFDRIYGAYKDALEKIFGDGRIRVFDRVPKKWSKMRKDAR